jgi:hypothetical protein
MSYTFLRWNGKYGADSKFVTRDNDTGKQAVFTPGRTQDLVWTTVDLENAPEMKEWEDFQNETVDDLESIAF